MRARPLVCRLYLPFPLSANPHLPFHSSLPKAGAPKLLFLPGSCVQQHLHFMPLRHYHTSGPFFIILLIFTFLPRFDSRTNLFPSPNTPFSHSDADCRFFSARKKGTCDNSAPARNTRAWLLYVYVDTLFYHRVVDDHGKNDSFLC